MSERGLGLVVLLVFGRWGRSTGRRGRLGVGLLFDADLVLVLRVFGGWGRCTGWSGRFARGLLLDVDLFLEGVAEIVRCALELTEALAE